MQSEKIRLVFRPDPKDVPEITRRTELVAGQPFITLRNIPAHRVLGAVNGFKMRRAQLEQVFNDTILMEFVYAGIGPPVDEVDPPGSTMYEARKLAREVYGAMWQWAKKNYGVYCLECSAPLPTHTPNCTVPTFRARIKARL